MNNWSSCLAPNLSGRGIGTGGIVRAKGRNNSRPEGHQTGRESPDCGPSLVEMDRMMWWAMPWFREERGVVVDEVGLRATATV